MRTIKVQYDMNTGMITGYYPSDIEYSEYIKPYIVISEQEYSRVLHHEDQYRIQNKTLVNISDTADYQLEQNKKLVSKASLKISERAALSYSYGVIFVSNKYYVNVSWLDYYEYMLSYINSDRSKKDVGIKFYKVSGAKYFLQYIEFEAEAAKSVVSEVISSIKDYRESYIPEKQKEYIDELNRIKESGSLSTIKQFYDEISYGSIIDYEVPIEV